MYNECRHIFTSGRKCQSPALKEQPFCYFHSNTRKRPAPANQPYEPYVEASETALSLPSLEDADAIQLAICDVVLALAANRIDSRRARILIYGLQVASQNHHYRIKEQAPVETVREAHSHADGTLIGPEKQSPDREEAAKINRPPSLGQILLREAEALKAQRQAEQKPESAEHARPLLLPNVHAVAEHKRPCRVPAAPSTRTRNAEAAIQPWYVLRAVPHCRRPERNRK